MLMRFCVGAEKQLETIVFSSSSSFSSIYYLNNILIGKFSVQYISSISVVNKFEKHYIIIIGHFSFSHTSHSVTWTLGIFHGSGTAFWSFIIIITIEMSNLLV